MKRVPPSPAGAANNEAAQALPCTETVLISKKSSRSESATGLIATREEAIRVIWAMGAGTSGLTLDLTGALRPEKPAVARRVQRLVVLHKLAVSQELLIVVRRCAVAPLNTDCLSVSRGAFDQRRVRVRLFHQRSLDGNRHPGFARSALSVL